MNVSEIRPVFTAEPVVLIEEGHQYIVGEGLTTRSPLSLSALLKSVGLATDYSKASVPPEHIQFRSYVGNATHRAAHAIMSGFAPEVALDDADPFVAKQAEPHVDAFLKFIAGHEMVPAYLETPTYQPELDYCCTADFAGLYDGRPAVIDYKTTSRISKTVALQTAGQALAFRWGVPLDEVLRGALHLRKDGTPKMVWFPHTRDFVTVEQAANVAAARKVYVA